MCDPDSPQMEELAQHAPPPSFQSFDPEPLTEGPPRWNPLPRAGPKWERECIQPPAQDRRATMGEARGRGDEAGNVTLGSHSDQTGKHTQRSTDREEAGRRRSRSSCSLMAAAAPPPTPSHPPLPGPRPTAKNVCGCKTQRRGTWLRPRPSLGARTPGRMGCRGRGLQTRGATATSASIRPCLCGSWGVLGRELCGEAGLLWRSVLRTRREGGKGSARLSFPRGPRGGADPRRRPPGPYNGQLYIMRVLSQF